jgi:outer membrane protein assembly factor BamB
MLKRVMPGSPDDHSPIMQGSTMAFIAVIVPLTMVVIASTVYIRFGKSAQYDENYKQAINEAVGAIGQSDAAIVRRAWESTLYYLDRAESYQVTQDSYALREQAQGALDAMDQIIRLDFRPAIIGGLAKTIQVGRMVASETDLYMLNIPQGNVLRAFMTSQGYEVDGNFICGPGSYASVDDNSNVSFDVGSILDMVALPRINDFGATLMAMDATGTLLFCSPNIEPKAWKLEEPDIRWKNLVGFSVSSQDYSLYILDPSGNAVWEFSLDKNSQYSQAPDLFFSGGFMPQNLNQTIDISISRTDIYLLFDDGHVTHCTPGLVDGSGETVIPIRCNDPETMTDTRSGHQSGEVLSDAHFTEFTFISSSDPSLYLLAPATAAIYRFSPRPETLFMQNQFRAAVGQEKTLFNSPISALAISPNRYIFLSAGSQIYFAMDVP